jgi:hypothetical protein
MNWRSRRGVWEVRLADCWLPLVEVVLVLVLVLVRGAFRSIARKLLLRVCQRDVRRDRTFCIMRGV